jgi:hypothetical protein
MVIDSLAVEDELLLHKVCALPQFLHCHGFLVGLPYAKDGVRDTADHVAADYYAAEEGVGCF